MRHRQAGGVVTETLHHGEHFVHVLSEPLRRRVGITHREELMRVFGEGHR